MKVAIIGSRTIIDADIGKYIPPDATQIISGGAIGVDSLAEQYAREREIEFKVFRPDYELYGKSAPLIRDRLIVDHADRVVAIWDGKSSGTSYTISYAKSRRKPIEVFIVK